MTENAQNADFRRKPQIFADSPLLLEIEAFGGRRKPQKTADFRRKPKIFAENRRKPLIGLRHLRCVTFSSAQNVGTKWIFGCGSGQKMGSKPTFLPTLNPFRDIDQNPCLTYFKGGGNSFPKRALRQPENSLANFCHQISNRKAAN